MFRKATPWSERGVNLCLCTPDVCDFNHATWPAPTTSRSPSELAGQRSTLRLARSIFVTGAGPPNQLVRGQPGIQ